MMNFDYSVSALVDIVHGKLVSNTGESLRVTRVLTDSRRFASAANCAFFALGSARNDGHIYIPELYNKGIRIFICAKLPPTYLIYKHAQFILVDDTLEALQKIAVHHRNQFAIPVIGITGSNGKTITKEWLFQLLHEDYNIVRSPKSYNSQIGVPLSVLQMGAEHELAVFEAGISLPGEMQNLQPIIRPNIGIFTNIGPAHAENFKNNAHKISEKLKLFSGTQVLIYCSDHSEIHTLLTDAEMPAAQKIFTWGHKGQVDLLISPEKKSGNYTGISGKFKGKQYTIKIPFSDKASVEDAIHCWALMLYLGYKPATIAARMQGLFSVAMRLELKEGINNCTIINDSYNSDINSLRIALDFLGQQNQHKKKTLILSDILQSGKAEKDLYVEIAELAAQKKIDKFIGIGSSISKYADYFKAKKYFYSSTENFLQTFPYTSFKDESILIKGARVFEFEKISKTLQQKAHETVLEINLSALIHNLNYYRSRLRNPATKIMAMVKAFSYGSGSYEIAGTLQFHRVDYLAVAYADEGVELRKAGINMPIMVMNPDEQSLAAIIKYALEPEIYNFRILTLIEKAVAGNFSENKPLKIHIKLDTGMHRLGFEQADLQALALRLKNNKLLHVQSVFTHLAASEDATQDAFTSLQIERFEKMSAEIIKYFSHPVFRHVLNSAGINRFPDAQFDMVRLGISLYGVALNDSDKEHLENVSTLKSAISQIKHIKAKDSIGYSRAATAEQDMTIAIIPVGYADGLGRQLGNGRGKMLVNNHFAPVVGNICMDMCMIDITGIPANEGDEVLVFGKQYTLADMAKDMQSIPYEIIAGISQRVKRVYFQE